MANAAEDQIKKLTSEKRRREAEILQSQERIKVIDTMLAALKTGVAAKPAQS